MTTIYKDAGRVQKVEEIGGGSSYDETSDATKSLNVDASGTAISGANPLPVTAVVTGDINIDNNAIGSMLIGKSGGGDFTTVYTSSTTITIGTMPYTHTFIADDILSVQQITTDGNVTNTFTRDDVAMTFTTATLTIVGAAFASDDTFVVYTNIPRSPSGATVSTPIHVSTGGAIASEVKDGRQTVTIPGTAVALATLTACKRVTITAETNNTDMVVVGGSTVVAALATRRGVPLYPGDSYSLNTDNLAEVYIDALTATDGCSYVFTV
jgi:hypothetical protein